MKTEDILARIPHQKPFLFVDEILEHSTDHIIGEYTFQRSADFFNGHFPQKAIVPGVLLTECAAQIGLACFGVILAKQDEKEEHQPQIFLSHSNMDFLRPVFPDQLIKVEAKLDYYRFNKLSVMVSLYVDNKKVASGKLQGMVA
jgi:3-hydroxyacyl-[acyl-carrier-protein] dehydratase